MQSCEFVEPMLSAYLDGELAKDDKARVEAHLAVCARCQGLVDAMRADDRALLSWAQTLSAPADMPMRVLNALGLSRQEVQSRRLAYVYFASLAVGVALVLAAVSLPAASAAAILFHFALAVVRALFALPWSVHAEWLVVLGALSLVILVLSLTCLRRALHWTRSEVVWR
ncbi:anti-sigma factor family protein [Alicyclobacillus acidocaldarius]|uniref:Anti-sigma-W factor RsiW n=1 Tax=Alicyclobacillus acidocaldarius subsp. acidocaldarius (strain ATCC 27009 / DSM 446 / BCRC 14685 / JCM 5260 / KCTC 1825 / NBRC 15652 / NCIMB 11725 / NRRL B-14509 / 104-IA) TaxID=521098 RepID=C8WTP5_ALIAD|nr:zf-HC2 domain-containing protein [Alicyclobacillus acidocaldarius]ACV59637.1 putative transmembrane anti-sigma factor [Alicyclobacillus acidocaldarius subsp. acidocaldarius DSM 446]